MRCNSASNSGTPASLAARLEDKAVQPLDPALPGPPGNVLGTAPRRHKCLLLGKYLDSAEVKTIDDRVAGATWAAFGQ